ncbi:hypothetical protein [Pontibacter beigongshangensis]|uniref:hypothetical protein n=1 Tax=Pontibacter beigongshangensis TaxID=2574733 RepID=UPI00164F850D|nr:hypothetical protein [Pontibacter beigongshangensis]
MTALKAIATRSNGFCYPDFLYYGLLAIGVGFCYDVALSVKKLGCTGNVKSWYFEKE